MSACAVAWHLLSLNIRNDSYLFTPSSTGTFGVIPFDLFLCLRWNRQVYEVYAYIFIHVCVCVIHGRYVESILPYASTVTTYIYYIWIYSISNIYACIISYSLSFSLKHTHSLSLSLSIFHFVLHSPMSTAEFEQIIYSIDFAKSSTYFCLTHRQYIFYPFFFSRVAYLAL